MIYHNISQFSHDDGEKIGILVTNLGSPDAPTKGALKTYLKEFLWDSRVVEAPPARWLWWLILNGIILHTRPAKSAQAYQEVWTDKGSPLLVIAKEQAEGIAQRLEEQLKAPFEVALGMRYGNPSIASALKDLQSKGVRRLLVLPLYPQYAAATTASTFDAVTQELQKWRWIPELRFINRYHTQPGYIQALAESIQQHWQIHGKPDHLIFSYHGIPQRYLDQGDPYHCECHTTTRLVAEKLGLVAEFYQTTFQSRFGKEEWIKPYTDKTIMALPEKGIKHLQVICPGFSADCLETIEEIDGENREYFEHAGGEKFSYIPALNSRGDHLDALTQVIMQHLQGWPGLVDFDGQKDAEERSARLARARAMGCPF